MERSATEITGTVSPVWSEEGRKAKRQVQEAARGFIARAGEQGMGKAQRDRAALEFTLGMMALAHVQDPDGRTYACASGLAFVVSVRGYPALEAYVSE